MEININKQLLGMVERKHSNRRLYKLVRFKVHNTIGFNMEKKARKADQVMENYMMLIG